jgi:pimeloyl-ACP methyl ester carboxylesterase
MEGNAMPRLSAVIIDTRIPTESAPGRRWHSCGVLAPATVAFAIAVLAALAGAAEPPKDELHAPQFWLIDTRCAPGCGDLTAGLPQIACWRLDESSTANRWQASDAAEFKTSAVPTTVLIHGYDTTPDSAVQHGNLLYCLMKQQAGRRAFRLIVWSWPTERAMVRPRPDARIKTCRSDVEAFYLACLLSKLPCGTPVSLVGHSLGCRALSGALQLLAGGSMAGRNLEVPVLAAWNSAGHPPVRVVMLAPAMDAGWLEEGCPCGLAPKAAESILVVANCRDHVLKWYSRLYGRHGPEAMGYVGPTSTLGGKLKVFDVSCELGRKHDFDLHQVSSPFCRNLAHYTFLGDMPATPQPPVGDGNDAKTLRTWTDASGKYRIEARFAASQEGTVRLQKADGRYVCIASDLLCATDRNFAAKQQ